MDEYSVRPLIPLSVCGGALPNSYGKKKTESPETCGR